MDILRTTFTEPLVEDLQSEAPGHAEQRVIAPVQSAHPQATNVAELFRLIKGSDVDHRPTVGTTTVAAANPLAILKQLYDALKELRKLAPKSAANLEEEATQLGTGWSAAEAAGSAQRFEGHLKALQGKIPQDLYIDLENLFAWLKARVLNHWDRA